MIIAQNVLLKAYAIDCHRKRSFAHIPCTVEMFLSCWCYKKRWFKI